MLFVLPLFLLTLFYEQFQVLFYLFCFSWLLFDLLSRLLNLLA
jgi:hypothetical protein